MAGLFMKVIVTLAWLTMLLASASLATSDDADAASVAADQPAVVRPSRMGEGCAGAEDIAIYQVPASPLPGGVPAYQVEVINQCACDEQECAIAGIHVRCGSFSSVNLVDSSKFRLLHEHDDNCLLKDGRPLLGGDTISFEYGNSFPYELSDSAATCVHP